MRADPPTLRCECGVLLEADTQHDLAAALFEHIAVSHDAPLRADPEGLVAAAEQGPSRQR